MKLQAHSRLLASGSLVTALAFNKLPFDKDPPDDFKEKFLKKFSGKEGVSKLWIYRRALRSYMDQPQYKKWCALLDETEKEIK